MAARTSLLGVYPPMGQSDANNLSALGTMFGDSNMNVNRMGSMLPPIDGHKFKGQSS